MELVTILAQTATVYPIAVNGGNLIISANTTVQIGEQKSHLSTSGSALGDKAFYINFNTNGPGIFEFKWSKNTIYVCQNSGSPVTISVISWCE